MDEEYGHCNDIPNPGVRDSCPYISVCGVETDRRLENIEHDLMRAKDRIRYLESRAEHNWLKKMEARRSAYMARSRARYLEQAMSAVMNESDDPNTREVLKAALDGIWRPEEEEE